MNSYEKRVKKAEEITNKLVSRLNSLNLHERVSSILYSRTRDLFLNKLVENNDANKYEKLVDRALEITNNDMKKLNSLNLHERVNITKYMEIFFKHLRNLTSEQRTNSKSKSQEAKVILESKKDKKYAIFLSHSVKDKKLAGLLKELFSDLNIDCFVAHDDIDEGSEWKPMIVNTLKNSTILFVLCTKNIEESPWVNFEVGLGYKKTIPFFIEDLSDKVSYIKDLQGVKVDRSRVGSSLIGLIDMSCKKLGLKKSLTDKEIKSKQSFVDLENYISQKIIEPSIFPKNRALIDGL